MEVVTPWVNRKSNKEFDLQMQVQERLYSGMNAQ